MLPHLLTVSLILTGSTNTLVHPAGNPLLFPAPAWPAHPVLEPGHEGHAAVAGLAENSWTGHCWKLITTHLCSQLAGARSVPVPHLPSTHGVTCLPEPRHSCMSQQAQGTASTGRAGSPQCSQCLSEASPASSAPSSIPHCLPPGLSPCFPALMAHTSTSSTGQMSVFCHTESFTSQNSSFYCVCILTHYSLLHWSPQLHCKAPTPSWPRYKGRQ